MYPHFLQAIDRFPCKSVQKPAVMKWCSWLCFAVSHSGWAMWGHTECPSRKERHFPNAFPGTEGDLLISCHQIPSSSQLLISLAKPKQQELVLQENIFLLNAENLYFFQEALCSTDKVLEFYSVRFNCRIQGPSSVSSRNFYLQLLQFQI